MKFFGFFPLWTFGCIYSSLMCTESSIKNLFLDKSPLVIFHKPFQ